MSPSSQGVYYPLAISLFGALEVWLHGALQPPLRSRKTRWLLALLTLQQGRALERDWLAGTLWPDSQESQALFSLRQRLTELRRALGAEAPRLLSPTPRTLRLDLSGAFCDLWAFDAAVARGDLSSLQEAVALYRGPLMEGCTEEWALPEREAREQMYLGALERLAQQAQEAGDPGEAASLLRRVIAVDPLRESAQRDLMQALAQDGDQAAAVQVYRELRLYLHQELQAEPDPETTALFHTLRQHAQTRAQAPSSQRLPPDPPRRSPRLPVQLTRFFGREEEIARLHALLSPSAAFAPAPRLLTLTGPGGSGKTRLAVEAAQSLKEAWNGAVWFVSLAPLSEARLIPDAIVEALGLPRTLQMEPMEQVVACLNGLNSPALLLLDNFEHLLAAGTPLVKALLERVPALTCLVTSRQPLNVEGEREFPLLPLPVPESQVQEPPDPERLMQCSSVALLVDRMQARRPDFQVTPGNAAAVAELVHRLEGIPLAIELAAARAQVLTPAQMLSQLSDRFRFLTSRRRDLDERHRTLHAALDWSYRLLVPELQRFYARLSVFRGGWTVEAAEAVCEEPLALDYLEQLRECSLVLSGETDGKMRFWMLETLREYADECLSEPERASAELRHIEYYIQMFQDVCPSAARHRQRPQGF